MIIIIFLLCSSELSWAQDKAAEQKIQAARIALITERLGLTPEQAEKFWPLYNEFSQKRKGLRQEYNREKSKLNVETATEAEKRLCWTWATNSKNNHFKWNATIQTEC